MSGARGQAIRTDDGKRIAFRIKSGAWTTASHKAGGRPPWHEGVVRGTERSMKFWCKD